MAFKFITSGYSGCLFIDFKKQQNVVKQCLVASYNLVMNNNFLVTRGMIKSYYKKKTLNNQQLSASQYGMFTSLGGQYIKDFATYELTVDIEPNFDILKELLNCIVYDSRKVGVIFNDKSHNITYDFSNNSWLKSINVNVSENSIATISVSFYISQQNIELNFGTPILYKGEDLSSLDIIGENKVLPYWAFALDFNTLNKDNVISFSFDWNRDITPNFECGGSTSLTAIEPEKLIFGLPQCNFNITYLVGDSAFNILNDIDDLFIDLFFNGQTLNLKFTNSIVNSCVPSVINKTGYNSIEISGNVLGQITVN